MDELTCRTCLEETDESIFKIIILAEQELSLVEMINESMGLEIKETDEMPLNICDKCTEAIIKSYVFRKKCWDSHKILLQRLEEQKIKIDSVNSEEASDTEVIFEEASLSDIIEEQSTDIVPDKSETSNESDFVNCELCDKTFLRRQLMIDHLRTAHNILEYHKYDCSYCKRSFWSLRSLQRHILSTHKAKDDSGANFICEHCGQKFKSRVPLVQHLRRHTGEKPFKCDKCDYRAAQQTTVTIHMRTHTKVRPYKCYICGKLFRTSSTRATHLIGHSEETPHECKICFKKFKKQGSLREHTVIHNLDQYTPCKFCGKKFARKDNLHLHEMQHTGEKPHVCEHCGKGFIRKHCWQTHMKHNHK